jgi:hypothetical protein
MSDSMVERVARAYVLQMGVHPETIVPFDDSDPNSRKVMAWKKAVRPARAIIAAMRESTDVMVDAGELTADEECECMYARDVWEAMIDAALAEAA